MYTTTFRVFYVYSCFAACISVHNVHAWCVQKLQEGIRFLGTQVTDNC